jgi:hypothetical protein
LGSSFMANSLFPCVSTISATHQLQQLNNVKSGCKKAPKKGLRLSITGSQKNRLVTSPQTDGQHGPRIRQSFQPGPGPGLEAQTTGAVGQGLGRATQNAQALLVQVLKAGAQAAAGLYRFGSRRVLCHAGHDVILEVRGDAFVSIQWQLCDSAQAPAGFALCATKLLTRPFFDLLHASFIAIESIAAAPWHIWAGGLFCRRSPTFCCECRAQMRCALRATFKSPTSMA